MSRQQYCRFCQRLAVDAHQPWCPLAPGEPAPDEPALDDTRAARAENDYADAMRGEHAEWSPYS
jgi:hypothetical protein